VRRERLRHLAVTPRRWPDAAAEAMALASPEVRSAPATWPLDAELLSRCTLLWPERYGWGPAEVWADGLQRAMARHVTVERADLPQCDFSVVHFGWRDPDGRLHRVALDYADSADLDPGVADGAELVFKMQHRAGGYGAEHVVPGGYVPAHERVYRLLRRARRRRDERAFHADVYGRFSLAAAADVRRRAVTLLREQDRLHFDGDLKVTRYGRSLMDAAGARVCLDLPGRGDLCHRLVEYLAVGTCVVAVRHRVELHVPLVDGEHLVYVEPDLDGLVETCARLAADERERERLAANARSYFDRYLHRDQLAAYYLQRLSALA
jgi:hypothetical protein